MPRRQGYRYFHGGAGGKEMAGVVTVVERTP